MPTLVAVRNNPIQKFSDKIRDLDTVKVFIQRDKLQKVSKGNFVYKAEGFRGTGDYGEVVMTGDQIVDLDGNLLGIAIDRNKISSVGKAEEWEMYEADPKTLVSLFKE